MKHERKGDVRETQGKSERGDAGTREKGGDARMRGKSEKRRKEKKKEESKEGKKERKERRNERKEKEGKKRRERGGWSAGPRRWRPELAGKDG